MRAVMAAFLILLVFPVGVPAQEQAEPMGLEYLDAAREAEAARYPLRALFLAGKAAGFSSFIHVADEEYPPLLAPGTPEFAEALEIIGRNDGYLMWSTPTVAKQQHPIFETTRWNLAWSPDGSRFASMSNCYTAISIYDGMSGALLARTGDSFHHDAAEFAWSPDGASIAVAEGCSCGDEGCREFFAVRIYDVRSGEETGSLEGRPGSSWHVSWSTDGSRLWASGNAMTAYDVDDMSVVEEHELLPGTMALARSRDGRWLAGADWHGNVYIGDMSDDSVLGPLAAHQHHPWSLTWSPDAVLLASGSGYGDVVIWDAATGEPLHMLETAGGYTMDLAWSPDGSRLAATSGDKSLYVWDATNGTLADVLPVGPNVPVSVAWSPDGSRIVCGDDMGFISMWDVENGRIMPGAPCHLGDVYRAAWSEDGTLVASLGVDGVVHVWDAANGSLVSTHDSENPPSDAFWLSMATQRRWRSTGMSPDGRLEATWVEMPWERHTSYVSVYDAASGDLRLVLPVTSNSLHDLVWSPDSTRLALCGPSMLVWDVTGGGQGKYDQEFLRYFEPHGNGNVETAHPLGNVGEVLAITRH